MSNIKAVISKKGYGIYLNSISKDELSLLEKTLTVKPKVLTDYDFGEDNSFPVYRISETRIYVPKYYGIKKYGSVKNIIKDGVDANLIFNGNLKDNQIDFSNKILNILKTNHSCIPCSPTGSGKTVFTLWLLCQLKKRTIILVHKEFLMNQWIERIKQFIPDASIGIIQQNKCEIDNDIIIGMIQTITKRDYPSGTFDSIHICCIDEAHHVACKVFSQIFFKLGCKITIGLSATPTRSDGLTKVLEWFLGPIIKNEAVSEIQKPTVKFIESEYGTNITPKFNFKGNLNAPNMINQLVVDPVRNKQIIDEIILLNKEGRKILVLSGRRGHCEYLSNELKKINENYSIGLYLGSMKKEDLDESNKADIILATYSMASEAYDNPDLDTLIMATGMGSVQQSVGRIIRKKNKFYPLVVDFTDILYFGSQASRRKQFYKKNEYNFYDKLIKIKDNLDNKLENNDICLFD